MAEEVFLCDRFGNHLSALTEAQVRDMSWDLNLPGAAALEFPDASHVKNIVCGRDEVQIWVDDALSWWGVPWTKERSGGRWTLACEELLSLFRYRFVTNTSLLNGLPDTNPPNPQPIEQTQIAANTIDTLESQATASFNIGIYNPLPVSQTRLRRYPRNEHQNLLDILSEFPTLENGFDFAIEVDGSGQRLWRPYWPAKGVVRNNLVLEHEEDHPARNILDYTYREDATRLATQVYYTGGSSGDIKFENNFEDAAASADLDGTFTAILSESGQKDVNWLLDRARGAVSKRKAPVKLVSVRVSNHPVPLFGVLQVGDQVPVRIPEIGVSGLFKIISIKWNPGNVLDLAFKEPDLS